MLSQIWCLASCGQFVHLYHLFCMNNNAMFHFYCSLYLLISGALIEFNLFDPSRSSVVRFTGFAAIWEAVYEIPKWAKLWYRTIWNLIDAGIFPVPVYRASLLPDNQCLSSCYSSVLREIKWQTGTHFHWFINSAIILSFSPLGVGFTVNSHTTYQLRQTKLNHANSIPN